MMTTALAATIKAAEVAAEETVELPADPWVFGVSALVLFGVLLGVTWAFRSVAHKH
jgi:hypothetical protein